MRIVLVFLFFVISACTNMVKETSQVADENYRTSDHGMGLARSTGGTVRDNSYDPIIKYTPYVATDKKFQEKRLPAVFSERMTYVTTKPVYADAFFDSVSEFLGVPIVLSATLKDSILAQKAMGDDSIQNNAEIIFNNKITPRYEQQQAKNILDRASSLLGVDWEYRDGTIYVSRFHTKLFFVHAPAVDNEFEAIVSSNSSSDNENSNSRVYSKMGSSSSLWDSIELSIANMLSAGGSHYVDKAFGTVQVNDTKSVIAKVEQYIDKINKEALKSISFDIEIVQVEMSRSQDFALSLDLVLNGNTFDIGGGSGAVGDNLKMTIGGSGAFSGSKALLDAMEKVGTITTSDRINRLTLNHQTTTLQLANKQAYVREVGTVLDNGTSETTVLVDDLVTGLTMQLSPSVINRNELQLGVVIDQSRLLSLDEFSPSADQKVQQPRTAHAQTMSQLKVRSGQTLMVTGFESLSDSNSVQGPVSSNFWLFGGSRAAEKTKTITVMLITPKLV